MSETFFPVNDLLRRKLQTSLTIATLALSVASTLLLLLFSDKVGLGISSADNILTKGLSAIFAQFLVFVGILIFAVGAVVTSFIVFLMMTQRTRDFGLMKAVGCPNGLVAGYFMTELILTTLIGCTLGVVSGVVVDYAVSNLGGFQTIQKPTNYWLALLVFAAFSALAFVFGTKPILKAAKMSPVKALSPVNYFGLTATKKLRHLSGHGLTWRIASRSLFRRQTATIRIIILLSTVFILLTVVIVGGKIASDTTVSWVERTVDRNTIAIAHNEMATQYTLLLSKFSGGVGEKEDFNYLDEKLSISNDTIQQLSSAPGVSGIDARLVLKEHVREVSNFSIDPETLATYPVGDSREADSLIVGVDPRKTSVDWSIQGRTLGANDTFEAVIGDSVAHALFSPNPSKRIIFSNPLVQGVRLKNNDFRIVGVCVDPINNGQVIYVPIQKLENITNSAYPNIVLVHIASSADPEATAAEIRNKINGSNPDLAVIRIDEVIEKNVDFLQSIWATIMLLPLFTLASAALCLVGYIMIATEEQKQEFAILRAIGGKPRLVTSILAFQSLVVLFSGFALGMSLGVITTLLILMSHPMVTSAAVMQIAAWLLSALAVMFVLSLYPAFKIAKTSILKIMA